MASALVHGFRSRSRRCRAQRARGLVVAGGVGTFGPRQGKRSIHARDRRPHPPGGGSWQHGKPRVIAMVQERPQRGERPADLAELAASLNLSRSDLIEDLPAQVVSTGAAHLLVQAKSRAAVDRANPDTSRLAASLRTIEAEGCYLYCLETVKPDSSAYARFFNPTMGLWEDPATGTAAGPLASHLVHHGIVSDGSTIFIEQGHSMGRPSRIELRVRGDRVTIAGAAVLVAEGTLHC
jgi:trans-2,3-dihydro-3-hydroxyanthranilate isomerase